MLVLKELVRVALSKLEYPMEHAHKATGKGGSWLTFGEGRRGS